MSLPVKFTRVKIQEQITYLLRESDHITYYGIFLGRFFKDETRKFVVSESSTETYPIYIFKKKTIVKATGQGEVGTGRFTDENAIRLFTFGKFMQSLTPDPYDMSPELITIQDPDTETLFEEIHKWNNSNNAENQIVLPNEENTRYSEFLEGKTSLSIKHAIETTIPVVEQSRKKVSSSKKTFVKLKSGEYSLLKYDKDGYYRGREKYTTPAADSTVITLELYKNKYRGKKKGGNRKTIKSTKKQTKKSKSYKRRTIKKH
jgi:hypothetical protein